MPAPDQTSATDIDAIAVNTVAWLSSPQLSIVVPVYQRQYRWDIGGCEQLLADIRAVAGRGDRDMHFIGSILSTAGGPHDTGELVLIDGQQRITTLMLLIAALHHTVRADDPALAAQLERVLVRDSDPDRTRLRPHEGWAAVFEDVVLDRRVAGGGIRDSRFDDNYAFFRSQISAAEAPEIWRGVQKLEHVAITLGVGANAQQIFASLNSTGEPLRDHELIHNYVLMGLTHAQQSHIEEAFWVRIEQDTGESIGGFWRHYLVMATGREVAVSGEHGVYAAFRTLFPRLDYATLQTHAATWREYSAAYRTLMAPEHEPDPEVAGQLVHLNTFGRAMFPLLMQVYVDHSRGTVDRSTLITTMEQLQSLLLRRTVVGLGNDRLVARLCRARSDGQDILTAAVARITPSDERVRVALKFGDLPHAAYVLGRLGDTAGLTGLDIEHLVPLAPSDDWSGDGVRRWSDYSDDEQNSHRALAQTLGNLTLLEPDLAERALDASFPAKRSLYASSALPATQRLADVEAWGTAEIAERTARLTGRFLAVWRRSATVGIDDDGLTPILDAVRRRGWPRGWEREFEYTEYRGEHWEVHDVKHLFNRVFRRLWADAADDVVAFSARRGGPIYPSQAWNGQWDALDGSTFLYMGWDARYMLTAVQDVLDLAGLAPEVFVKYSYSAAAM